MALLLLETMAVNGKGLRQLLDETMDEIGHFHYRRIDLPLTDEARERLIDRLQVKKLTTIASRPVKEKNVRDGFKFIFDDGSWLLIRPSGTEPLLRIYCEAEDPAVVDSLLAAGREIAGI
jgi:phosphomannomutase